MDYSKKIRTLLRESIGPLFELRVINRDDSSEWLINYKDLLILLPNKNSDEEIDKDVRVALNRITDDYDYFDFSYANTISDLYDISKEYFDEVGESDFIIADISDNTLTYHSFNSIMSHGLESEKLHKIARILGIDNIKIVTSSGDTMSTDVKRHVDFPNEAYHGTSLIAFLGMLLSGGLRPMGRYGHSNYSDQGIYHADHIFLTTNPQSALHHAINAAYNDDSSPIIIKLRIPDKRYIAPDYDVDTVRGSTHFSKVRSDIRVTSGSDVGRTRALGLSRDVGRFGYAGRIPVSHFIEAYGGSADIDIETNVDDLYRVNIKDLLKSISILKNFGIDLNDIYDYGFPLEFLMNPYDVKAFINKIQYKHEKEEIEESFKDRLRRSIGNI